MGVAKKRRSKPTVRYLASDLGPKNIRRQRHLRRPALNALLRAESQAWGYAQRATPERSPLRRNVDAGEVAPPPRFSSRRRFRRTVTSEFTFDCGYNIMGFLKISRAQTHHRH